MVRCIELYGECKLANDVLAIIFNLFVSLKSLIHTFKSEILAKMFRRKLVTSSFISYKILT